MSRRQRTAPKASISPSVRLGLTSIVAGNEAGIRTMLSATASDDLVEKLAEPHVDCMGVSNLNAEMLLANYFSAGMLAKYAKAIGKSDKGGAATLAERIAREWAKPSFAPPASTTTAAAKAEAYADDEAEGSAKRQLTALEEIKAKRAKQAAKQAASAPSSSSAPPAAAEEKPSVPRAAAYPFEFRGSDAAAALDPPRQSAPEPTAAPAAPRQFEVWRNEVASLSSMGEPLSAWAVELAGGGWWVVHPEATEESVRRVDRVASSKPAGYTERHLVEEGCLEVTNWGQEMDYHLVLSGKRGGKSVDELKPFVNVSGEQAVRQ